MSQAIPSIINGKQIATALRETIRKQVVRLKPKPGLAVVLVGEDPASHVYVRNKARQTEEVGMQSFEIRLPAAISEKELLTQIEKLNCDTQVHGILVQLPLPKHISENNVIMAIDPAKDVDGFHPINSSKLMSGMKGLVPCTPKGCLMLIQSVAGKDLSGLHSVVIGRSNIVGKPMAQLLLQANATVTVIHSKTKAPEKLCAQADIVVTAIGRPKHVTAEWIKQGAIVIDVGINRLEGGSLCGDVDYEQVAPKAKAITPVPGGVGPMTIACLLENTVEAYRMQHES